MFKLPFEYTASLRGGHKPKSSLSLATGRRSWDKRRVSVAHPPDGGLACRRDTLGTLFKGVSVRLP